MPPPGAGDRAPRLPLMIQIAVKQDHMFVSIVSIIAEMMMGGYGLGGAMMEASRLLDSQGVFAGIVEIAVVGHCVITVMALVRRRLLVWHTETLEPTTV